MTAGEWELSKSKMFPFLDQYQKEGYQALMKIVRQHRGGFLCDGVGLGKTFIGLMLIERLIIHERKRVALFVPKSTLEDVWVPHLRQYLPHVGGVSGGDFSNLSVFSHTDLGREGDFPYRFERMKSLADAVIIDEGHHFRNPGLRRTKSGKPSRYRQLYDILRGPEGVKNVFLLTATPINNSLHDFRHMLELFTGETDDYFRSTVGINSIRGHFITMERELDRLVESDGDAVETNMIEAENLLKGRRTIQRTGCPAEPGLREAEPVAARRQSGRLPRPRAARSAGIWGQIYFYVLNHELHCC